MPRGTKPEGMSHLEYCRLMQKNKYHSDPLEKVKGNIKYYKGLYKENPDFMKIYNNQELNLLERQYEMKQFHFNLKLAKLSA